MLLGVATVRDQLQHGKTWPRNIKVGDENDDNDDENDDDNNDDNTDVTDTTGVVIGHVDCTADDNLNRPLCSAQGVKGFPTLIIFKDGVKVIDSATY